MRLKGKWFSENARPPYFCARSFNVGSLILKTKRSDVLSELNSWYVKAYEFLKIPSLIQVLKVFNEVHI